MLFWGAVPDTVGCLATALSSTHQLPVVPPPGLMARCPPVGVAPRKTTALALRACPEVAV